MDLIKTFRLLLIGLLLPTIAAAAIACGGDGDEEEAEPTPEASAEETEDSESEVKGDSVTVDLAFWHAGWKVTLGEAALTPDDFGSAAVMIEADFENLGVDPAVFDSQALLTSGSIDFPDETFEGHDYPEVPGERTGKGSFNFQVDDEFTLDEATLIIGNPSNNQAIVPIGEEGDEYVSLEPQDVAATGDVVAGAVTVTVESAEVRADLPDRHSEMEEGKLAMIVYFSATPASGIQIGQGVLQSPNVALELPDGTSVAVIDDGVSGVNELLQGREGTTISDLKVRFPIDEPAEGTYKFILKGAYGPGGANVEGELAFVVEPAATGAPSSSSGY
jgi:hypothetical protein